MAAGGDDFLQAHSSKIGWLTREWIEEQLDQEQMAAAIRNAVRAKMGGRRPITDIELVSVTEFFVYDMKPSEMFITDVRSARSGSAACYTRARGSRASFLSKNSHDRSQDNEAHAFTERHRAAPGELQVR